MGRSSIKSLETEKILKDFKIERTPKEKRQARIVSLLVFVATLLLIGLASAGRFLPRIWEKVNTPVTVLSQKFTPIPPSPTPVPKFEEEKKTIKEILKPLRGNYGIYYEDLTTGDFWAINGDGLFETASLLKLPVIMTLYQGAEAGWINLETVYKLQAADKRDGAGSLAYKPNGFEITYRKMAELMGRQSDNTAFFVITKVLGAEKIQTTIDNLGMTKTSYAQQMTTLEDMALFFRQLYTGKAVVEKSKKEIYSYLSDSIWEDRIPAGVPEDIKVVHKIGTLIGVISDAGIVFAERPYILVIMTKDANEIEAKKALPEISKKVWEMNEAVNR